MNVDFTSYPTETLVFLVKAISKEIKSRQKACQVVSPARKNAERRAKFIKSLNSDQKDKRDAANESLLIENSSSLLSVPNRNAEIQSREKYFSALIRQDWSSVYPDDDGPKKFYVYVHVDPSKRCFVATSKCGGNYGGLPFYVGKGTGDRAYDLKRNQGHGKMIKSVLDAGFLPSDIVHVPFRMLTEAKAFEIEAKLIYFFKTVYECPKFGSLYNLDIPKVPAFTGTMARYFTRAEVDKILAGENFDPVDETKAQS